PAGTTVMPNGQYTFNFTLTAPTTPGTYTTDWQMVHMLVRWFGAQVVKQVQVSGPAGVGTLNSKAGGTITVDGNSSDWDLGSFTTKTRGGMNETGDYAILGFDGGTCYYGARCTDFVLPANAADHTAKVYSRDKATYLYFLVRCDDNDIRYNNPTSANWANDCVEFYIDPSHNHGANPISNSTSDFQLVIDANNQKNVYMCTSGYKTQVLGGVTSAVVRDGTGWWLEVRITKTAIDPDLPGVGTIGFDISCRDNDNNNDPADTSVYTWQDPELSAGCPTKIPNRWGELDLSSVPDTTPPGNVSSFTGTSGPGKVTLNWTNPSDSDYTAVMIRFKTTGYPTSITDGTFVVDDPGAPGAADSFVHGGTPGVTYYYKAFAHDGALNYASGVTASGTPTTDTTAPCPVTNFAAVAGNQQVSFSWINPSDADFTGTMIRFKTTGYPTSVTDGEEIYNGAGWSMSHIDLTNGTTYYYSAFAYGGVPNYATKTDVSAATPAGLTWDVQYEGSVLPSVASPAWIVGPGYENWAYIDTGTVRVDDDSPDSGSQIVWRQGWAGSNSAGTTVEARMRCNSITYNSTQKNIQIFDGTKTISFLLYTSKIEAVGGSGGSYNLTGSSYHTYRFTLQGNTWNVYLDGNSTAILSGTPDSDTTANQLKFGVAGWAGQQNINFDYVYYTTTGAYAP
ncbi:MAG: sugar-binding protein, partial [Armatimonadota bacterium]|nr:sugar-binding protein [Armatimonadota bacterium]